MTPTAVMAEARRLGIELSERDGGLHVVWPPGAMTPEFRAALIEHKPGLLTLLRAEAAAPPADAPEAPPPVTSWYGGWIDAHLRRVAELEAEGLSHADAHRQACAEAEELEAVLDPFEPPAYEPPPPPRPAAPPTFGWTRAGHVVELPRTASDEAKDALRRVSGWGWAAWYPAD
jgi:hypothetical protein